MSTKTKRQRRPKRPTQKLIDECMAIAGCLLDADGESMSGDRDGVIEVLTEAAARLKCLRTRVYKVIQTMKGQGNDRA